MSFQTLASLTALTAPLFEEKVVTEAKSGASDFKGIDSVIQDSLADLHDKVAALMTLAKETGATKLDTVKDKDGMTVFKKIDKLTKEYKSAMTKLMAEAEAMVMQVAEGQVDEDEALLVEGKNYSDSADFTEEFYDVIGKVNEVKRVVKSPRFMGWMKSTDHNFGPGLAGGDDMEDEDATPSQSCEAVAQEVIGHVDSLSKSLGTLEDMLHNAA